MHLASALFNNDLRVSVMHMVSDFHVLCTKSFCDVGCCCHLHFKFGLKSYLEGLYNPSYKGRKGNFERARRYMGNTCKPYPSCTSIFMGRLTNGICCWRCMISEAGLFSQWSSNLYLFICFFQEKANLLLFIYCCLHS